MTGYDGKLYILAIDHRGSCPASLAAAITTACVAAWAAIDLS
jgi:hypothetical protein